MKSIFKRHISLIILIIILIVFPTSLSNQAKLNMRIIVTGIAVDKSEEGYELTAQIVKTTPGTEAAGTSATIDFISDKGETIAKAISLLAYKAGKVSAFSHTNFIVLGNDMLKEEITECLDYFIRDNIIKNSTLLLFAEEKASDEIKKTKNIELSVGLGLQRVYLFKERESDGLMTTVLKFLNENKTYSKTATASVFSLKSAKEEQGGSDEQSGDSSGSGGSGGVGGGSGGSTSSGSSSAQPETMFFQAQTPIMCFVDGKFVGKLEGEDEVLGYMFSKRKCLTSDFVIDDMQCEKLKDSKVTINVKEKRVRKKVRYEGNTPCLDIKVRIKNAEINEVLSKDVVADLTVDEFDCVNRSIEKKVSDLMGACFSKSKSLKADIFGAYELAYKYNYNKTKSLFKSTEDFVNALKLNVEVEVRKLEY